MQLNRCPHCHSRISLEAIAQDEATRELLALLAKLDTATGTALLGYLGLFRSEKRDLANDRALRLANEVLELGERSRVAIAMAETVEAMRAKTDRKPLSNHNYLKQVLASVEQRPVVLHNEQQAIAPKSKTGQAFAQLEQLKHGQ